MASTTIQRQYALARKAGWRAHEALYAARAIADFESLGEDAVRLRAEPEDENYFDVYGEPEGYTDIHGRHVSPEQERKNIERSIERDGCWYVFSEWFDGDEWQQADGVGMCAGYNDPLSPFENWYIPDLMRAAVNAYREHVEDMAAAV